MTELGSQLLQADVCVVGAGIVGLAHALAAIDRGLTVVVLEGDRPAVGASVRNFGHIFVAAQADGANLEMALRSRERWLELADRAGLHVVPAGTLIIARHQDELSVLAEAAANPRRRLRLLTADEAVQLAPVSARGLLGAAFGELDLRVDPRTSVARLAELVDRDPRGIVRWGARVHDVAPGCVQASGLEVRAPLIVVCPGPGYRELPPGLRAGLESLTRCRLQMLRVAPPPSRPFGPALATGLSLVRYPAFTARPASAALAERLSRERPELGAAGIHLLVTQLAGGDLIIGDSHRYGDTLDGFADERVDDLLLAEAAGLFGIDRLTVRERWQGTYPVRSGDAAAFHTTAPMPGVRVVENVVGLGMTLSFGYVDRVLDELISAR